MGILGGGQLGRMMVLAAAPLGIETHIFSDAGGNCPAAQVTPHLTVAAFDDVAALAKFAASVDVITYEFENIPLEAVQYLATLKPVYPSPATLAMTQHRILEKKFINAGGIATALWQGVDHFAELLAIRAAWPGHDVILKTTQMGYDGKGQVKIPANATSEMAEKLWRDLHPFADTHITNAKNLPRFIAEQAVDFIAEGSVIIVRNKMGEKTAYPLVENCHRNHILSESILPMDRQLLAENLPSDAQKIAENLAERFDLIGILAVEMFVTSDRKILVNELAPRPHNSGHWSIDGCVTSQFEQAVRAVCGLSLGAIDLVYPVGFDASNSKIIMQNLLGDEVSNWPQILSEPYSKLHLYGKTDKLRGRKMGHVTRFVKI
ncbi:MAG: 5-(carboxyamino)imidazole ribonucleotide synthase [Alphaproteobacteria bacterium]|nr:5-(carboxyamino)imidazole ribonucleotide synthase [Alphaproteobacteria bacterium]